MRQFLNKTSTPCTALINQINSNLYSTLATGLITFNNIASELGISSNSLETASLPGSIIRIFLIQILELSKNFLFELEILAEQFLDDFKLVTC